MSKIVQERINFIELLHEVFFTKKGHGALAFITAADMLVLFDEYLVSGEAASHFVNRYVRSI